MATINQLSSVDTLQGGDQIPIYDQSNGDARKASLTALAAFLGTSGGGGGLTFPLDLGLVTDTNVTVTYDLGGL
jgi:hypothetical protein